MEYKHRSVLLNKYVVVVLMMVVLCAISSDLYFLVVVLFVNQSFFTFVVFVAFLLLK